MEFEVDLKNSYNVASGRALLRIYWQIEKYRGGLDTKRKAWVCSSGTEKY